ncbi:universal stress protein [Nitrincola sp.]|uniref:universal stress protein n=1 Tax=Nitrincola sp. TaxID=1926584 RepID=UPI003A8E3116
MSLKVLLPVDLQDRDAAIAGLMKVMKYLGGQEVCMHFMSILPGKPVPLLASYVSKEEVESALSVLKDDLILLVKQALPQLTDFSVQTTEGVVHKEILKYARELQPQLIMLPSHSHSKLENILIGSVTSKVVEQACCSVLVVR